MMDGSRKGRLPRLSRKSSPVFVSKSHQLIGKDTMELTAENVQALVKECMSKEVEGDDVIVIKAVVRSLAFLRSKLEERKDDIYSMLRQLPASFQSDGGGGMSFLNACYRGDGVFWSSFHLTMEALFALGIGAGVAEHCLPESLWSSFPGGMPYLVVIEQA